MMLFASIALHCFPLRYSYNRIQTYRSSKIHPSTIAHQTRLCLYIITAGSPACIINCIYVRNLDPNDYIPSSNALFVTNPTSISILRAVFVHPPSSMLRLSRRHRGFCSLPLSLSFFPLRAIFHCFWNNLLVNNRSLQFFDRKCKEFVVW